MINQKLLQTYIKNGFNILLQGQHGVGKTMILTEACKSLGLNLKYYSASSLDPYTDLVGIPEFITNEQGERVIRSVRPQEINDAEVVFFDELNRADPKVLNAVFELIQFRTINGEPLPNLKCVIAAQNPPDGDYTVDSLDPALADRFQICLEIKPEVSLGYLKSVLQDETAQALVNWHKAHGKKSDYISPRRIEMIGHVWEATQDKVSLAAAMPTGGSFDIGKLFNLLNNTALPEDLETLIEKSIEDIQAAIRNDGADKTLNAIKNASPEHKKKALDNIAAAMNVQFGPVTIVNYLDVIDEMSTEQVDNLVSGWTDAKLKGIGLRKEIREHTGTRGVKVFKDRLDKDGA